jgi:hypothetical protein
MRWCVISMPTGTRRYHMIYDHEDVCVAVTARLNVGDPDQHYFVDRDDSDESDEDVEQ